MEERSGVKFHEAQIALARQWVSGDEHTTQKDVVVVIPEEESLVPADKSKGQKTETVPIPTDDNAAREVVARFERGAADLRSDEPVADTVSQHMLADKTSLLEEKWLGTEEEELNAYVFTFLQIFSVIYYFLCRYVSELLYIHSKLMIVDDRRVIVSNHSSRSFTLHISN